jgi:Mrp family chromosome partitioning ATPase
LIEPTCAPALQRSLQTTADNGLVDFLQVVNRRRRRSRVTHQRSVVAAGGSPTARQVIDFALLGDMLARLRPEYDFVVVDSPPVNQYADASVLANKVDGVILVIEADRTPLAEAEAAKRQLERVGARILGVVLNRKRSYIPAFIESLL